MWNHSYVNTKELDFVLKIEMLPGCRENRSVESRLQEYMTDFSRQEKFYTWTKPGILVNFEKLCIKLI